MNTGIEEHGAFQINKSGGPPGGRIPPPPLHHGGGPGQGGQRPVVINGNPAQKQQNQQMQNQQSMQKQMMMQNQQHQHQLQQALVQQHQSMIIPPQPHRSLIPARLLEGPVVQISDIRKELGRLTEAEARDEVSDLFIFRFELADSKEDYDSDGERIKPTWAHARRTEVRGISKKEVSRQIKQLNIETRPLGEKKASLTDAQQRQLERTLEELELREIDSRFHTVLVQIDHKLREKTSRDSRERQRSVDRSRHGDKRHDNRKHGEKHRRYSDNRGRRETVEYTDMRGRRRSMVRETRTSKKPVRETVSLTAYYKRCPKADVDPVALLLQRDAENARQLQPPHPQHTFAAQQMHHDQLAMQQQRHQLQHQQQQHQQQHHPNMNMGMPMNNGMGPQSNVNKAMNFNQQNKQMQGNNMNRPAAVKVLNNQKPNLQRNKSPGPQRPHNKNLQSPTSSQTPTLYSDDDSEDDGDSILTPNSSHSSNSLTRPSIHQQQRRGSRGSKYIETRGSKYHESPHQFGIPPKTITPHKARRHDEHRISDEFLNLANPNPTRHVGIPLPPNPPRRELGPATPPYPLDLDEIEAKAYLAGRADERADGRERIDFRPQQRMIQQPPLLRRATLPIPNVHQQDLLLEDNHHHSPILPLPPSPPRIQIRPRVLQHRPSIRHIRPGDVNLTLEERDMLDSLERFRMDDHDIRRRDEERYGDDGLRRRERGEERYVDEYYDDFEIRNERRSRDEDIAFDRERERAERVERARGIPIPIPYSRRDRLDEQDGMYGEGEYEERNPFVPLQRPGMARRATVGFGGGREYI